MNDRKGRDIFYGVVAIATLIIAMIGATLAYFSITATSDQGAVNAKAAVVSIDYEDGSTVLTQADELIPSSFSVVQSAYLDAKAEAELDSSGSFPCVDSNDKEVCSIYRFTISSEGATGQDMVATLNVDMNTFLSKDSSGNYLSLGYALYDVSAGAWLNTFKGPSDTSDYYDLMNNTCIDANDLALITESSEISRLSGIATEQAADATKYICHDTSATGVDGYASNQVLSIFGQSSTGVQNVININNSGKTYDLVLFLLDNNSNQNVDQGATFKGTIKVSLSGSESRVTGKWTDD